MERKSQPSYTKSITGRAVTGLFAIHGNIDDYGDISYPGAFQRTISQRVPAGKIKFMWSHTVGDSWMGVPPEPPVALVKSIQEVGRDDLPQAVLDTAPTATGGVEITREYLETPRGDEVFKGVQSGAITEMSYGYDPITYDFGEIDGQKVRNLREIRLWEVSDVLWGANEATVASKWLPPTDILLKQLEAFLAEIKSGARHSSADAALINSIHKMALDLGATNCKGLVDEEAEGEQSAGKNRPGASQGDVPPLTLQPVNMLAYLEFISHENAVAK